MENYVTKKIDAIRKNLDDLVKERETVIKDLAEYGWELVDEKTWITGFSRTKDSKLETVSISYDHDDEDWKVFATGWLNTGELLTFSDYIDIRKMIDNM